MTTVYKITGYLTTPYTVEVEYDNEDDALEAGRDLITEEDESVIEGESEWADDFEITKEEED